jgi:tetratricopeptide (TPR) repeat protein
MRRTSLMELVFIGLVLSPSVPAKQRDANQLEEARRILREASQLVKDIPEGQQLSAAANIAGQLVRSGDLQAALATVHSLKKSDDQALPLGIVAWSMDHAGNGVGALNLLESADLGQNRAQAYQQLALSHLDRGDFSGALQVLDLVQAQSYLRVDMFIRIAQRKGKSGDMAGAREAIREALEVVERMRKQDPNCLGTLAGIAGVQAEIGDQAGASVTLNGFSEIVHQLRPDESAVGRDSLLQQLATGQAKTGNLVDAFRTIDELPEGSGRDFPLGSIAIEQAKQGNLREALFTISLISEPQWKALELREIAVLEGASGMHLEALEAVNTISSPGDRAYALATLALEQAEKDDPAAGHTLQLAVESANESKTKVPGHVFELIAVTKALLKDFSGAQESVASMSDAELRVWPLWNITAMMAEAGDVQGALSLAANEQAAHAKAYALLGAAQGILNHVEAEAKAKSSSSSH